MWILLRLSCFSLCVLLLRAWLHCYLLDVLSNEVLSRFIISLVLFHLIVSQQSQILLCQQFRIRLEVVLSGLGPFRLCFEARANGLEFGDLEGHL